MSELTSYLPLAALYIEASLIVLLAGLIAYRAIIKTQSKQKLFYRVLAFALLAASGVAYLAIIQVPMAWAFSLLLLAAEAVILVRLRPLRITFVLPLLSIVAIFMVPVVVLGADIRCRSSVNLQADNQRQPVVVAIDQQLGDLSATASHLVTTNEIRTAPTSNEMKSWLSATSQDSHLQLIIVTDKNLDITASGSSQAGWGGNLSQYANWTDSLSEKTSLSGATILANGLPYLIASEAITESDKSISGYLIIGKQLTADYVSSLDTGHILAAFGIADSKGPLVVSGYSSLAQQGLRSRDMASYLSDHTASFRQTTHLDENSYLMIGTDIHSLDAGQPLRLITLTDSALSSKCLR